MVNKKKRNQPDLEEILARPWCYYCERDFDDLKVLVAHQKAKHYKCDHCNRRLNTSGGLQVHLQQVHKATLTAVENAIDGRQNVEPEIFGMTGIPDELVAAHRQRVENEFNKQQADRRALTGNPPPGQNNGQPNSKKRKLETVEEMKARAAEHKAKRAAERQAQKEGKAAQPSPSNTPDPTTQSKPAPSASDFMAPPAQRSYDHSHYDQPQQIPLFAPYTAVPMQAAHAAGLPPSLPVQQPGQWASRMLPTSFSPPQAAPYAMPSFMPPAHSQATAQIPSVATYSHTISAPPNIVRQPAVLQPAPGLPARPSFDPPSFNREDMQRMHTGQAPPPANTAVHSRPATKPRKLSAHEQALEDCEIMLKSNKIIFQAKLAASNAAQEAANEATDSAAHAHKLSYLEQIDVFIDAKLKELGDHPSAKQIVAEVETMRKELETEYKAKQAAANAAQETANEAANPASDAQNGSASTTQEAANQATNPAANAQAGPANAPAPPVAPRNGPRQKRPSSLVYDHHDESPEQKMARRSKYRNDA